MFATVLSVNSRATVKCTSTSSGRVNPARRAVVLRATPRDPGSASPRDPVNPPWTSPATTTGGGSSSGYTGGSSGGAGSGGSGGFSNFGKDNDRSGGGDGGSWWNRPSTWIVIGLAAGIGIPTWNYLKDQQEERHMSKTNVIKEDIRDGYNTVKDKISHKAEEVEHAAERAGDKGKHRVEEAKDSTSLWGKKVSHSTEEAKDEAVLRGKRAAHRAEEGAQEAVDKAAEETHSFVDSVKGVFGSAKDKVVSAEKSVEHRIGDTAHSTKKGAQHAVDKARDAVGGALHGAGSKLHEAGDEVETEKRSRVPYYIGAGTAFTALLVGGAIYYAQKSGKGDEAKQKLKEVGDKVKDTLGGTAQKRPNTTTSAPQGPQDRPVV